MKRNTKPTRKSGKKKHYSREEVRKINERYQSKLEEYKELSDEQLNEILQSKASSTDKQAAYDTLELRRKEQIEKLANTNETPKAVDKTEQEVTEVIAE